MPLPHLSEEAVLSIHKLKQSLQPLENGGVRYGRASSLQQLFLIRGGRSSEDVTAPRSPPRSDEDATAVYVSDVDNPAQSFSAIESSASEDQLANKSASQQWTELTINGSIAEGRQRPPDTQPQDDPIQVRN